MIKYAKEKGVVDVMFNTNGSLLTEEISKKLFKSGLDKLFISFDSPFKERYDKIRVGTKFEIVLENVKTFIRLRKESDLVNPLVRVSMVVMKENKEDVIDYIKLWNPFVDLIGFSDYINPQRMDQEDRATFQLKEHKNFICSQLYQRLFVHWNGEIGLCCSDYDAEMNLGNANQDNIKDIWLGEKLQKIRELHENGKWNQVPLCAKCNIPYI